MRKSISIWAVLSSLLAAGAVQAQFSQYASPGTLAETPPPVQETLEEGAEEARWSVGRLRVDPRLWLREVAYQDNVFANPDAGASVADLRAKMGGGLVSYLNFGPKVIASAFVLPEYNWWRDQDQLRQLSFNGGFGVFGFFNRMTVIAEGQTIETQRPLNSELDVPIDDAEDRGALSVELELRGPWSLFASAEESRRRYSGDLPAELSTLRLSSLDLDFSSLGGGVRYGFSNKISVALGYWESETDFPDDQGLRSNTAGGPLVEISAEGNSLAFDIAARALAIEFVNGSTLRDSDELTFEGRIDWQLGELTEATLYGARNIIYSALVETGVFLEDRIGLSLRRSAGERFRGRIFYELGDTETIEVAGRPSSPAYAFDSWGLTLDLDLSASAQLTASIIETSFDSDLARFDRTGSSFGVGIRLGDASLPW